MATVMRIISSQKFWTSVGGIAAIVALNVTGVDYSGEISQWVAAITSVLVTVQGALDFKHGSVSDGTRPPGA